MRRRTFFTGERGGHTARDRLAWSRASQARLFFDSRSLACALDGRRSDRPGVVDRDIYVAVNAWPRPLAFTIPAAPSGRPWRRAVDTALASPEDIIEEERGPARPGSYANRFPIRVRGDATVADSIAWPSTGNLARTGRDVAFSRLCR